MKTTTLKISLACLLLCVASKAITGDVTHFYMTMPDKFDPLMSRQQRAELLEYVKAGMGDSITNRFGQQTRVEVLDTLRQRLVVRNTDISSLELKLLMLGGDTAVVMIRTVCAPVCHSVLQTYDTNWRERTDITFALPEPADWLDPEKVTRAEANADNLRHLLVPRFVSLTFEGDDDTLHARNHTTDYLSNDEREQVLPYLKEGSILCRAVVSPNKP